VRRGVKSVHVIVLAKAPVPGRVKTRLCPPLDAAEAAAVAEAALVDTLATACRALPGGVVLAIDGAVGPWLDPFDVAVVDQRGNGLARRIANAFTDVAGPAVLIGMDTPQVGARSLRDALHRLETGADAVLGRCEDGGFWAIGARRPQPELFVDVPMSTAVTGQQQLARLRMYGLDVAELPTLRDVDDFADAVAVAARIPRSRFAAALARVRTDVRVAAR
jgi:rSAM/selenodomain-associated transferase 1